MDFRFIRGFVALLCTGFCFGQRPQVTELPQGWSIRGEERALGEQLSREVRRHATIVDDPVITAYVNRLVQKVSAQCPAAGPIDVFWIRSDDMNGFALPGGFVFLNTGLMRRAGSEAELAGVLAHLVARVQARGLSAAGRPDESTTFASVPVIFVGDWSGYAYSSGAGTTLIPLSLVNAYRAAVSAADERGLQCLSGAGYDPLEFIQNLRRLQAAESRSAPASRQLSTHPSPAERIAHAQSVIDTLEPKPDYVVDTGEFSEMKRRIDLAFAAQRRRVASPPSLRK